MKKEEKKSVDVLFAELENNLHVSGSYGVPYHPDSIMDYERICNHDSGYLCEHRKQWIIDFIKTNFV